LMIWHGELQTRRHLSYNTLQNSFNSQLVAIHNVRYYSHL
jgi:hypothetical protein